MADAFVLFHFLRPVWLLALLPVVLIWWQVRPRKQSAPEVAEGIAPHLAKALTVGGRGDRRLWPIDGVAATLALLVLAGAGPTWTRVDNPLLAQTAPLAVALKVSPSMKNADLQPSRHERASFKILDLIDHRAGAQTALFAYAGSAHRVTPLTEDPNIVRSYLAGLSPDIMPEAGDRADLALALATEELARSETPGAILFVLDDLAAPNVAAFNRDAEARPPVIFLIAAGQGVQTGAIGDVQNASVVRLTADDTDVREIQRRVLSAYRAALLDDPQQDWEDRGWVVAWPALMLLLLSFRRGWTMRWALASALFLPLGTPAQAEGWRDWFLTADQQGQIAVNRRAYSDAADLFQNPEWRAYALLRAGRYAEAAEAFSAFETAEAAVAMGVAHLRNRAYRDGVRAFETALERDANNEAAQQNLEVARAMVAFVETQQLSSDTGEESGIGADDTVFDNETGQGAETEIAAEDGPPAGLSTEDWMRAVDTDVGDFLASRFKIETLGAAE